MANIKQFQHLKIQLEALNSATNYFADENCIGKGGFGKVYKGELIHSKGQGIVAIKRLDRVFGQGDPEFWKEIMMLSFYKHENIVSLLGYCDDGGEKVLVYDYASKKSLDLYLNNHELTWVRRLKICIGAARGLVYLHTPAQTQLRVLHRDIKSSNILLDENWNAKISDFGLSKFGPANKQFTYLVSNAVGTFGYCDPVYIETGLLTKESDVYSFGVVLFEVLCGRLCIGNKNEKVQPLTSLARLHYQQNKISEIIYSNIKDEINPDSLMVFTKIAYECLKRDREERPLMTEVMRALESALKYQCGGEGTTMAMKRRRVGILKVEVLSARLTKRNVFSVFNPYVILELTNSEHSSNMKTTAKHKNMNPEWNENFTLYVEDLQVQTLRIWVYNIASEKKHTIVGTGMNVLLLRDLIPEEPLKFWFRLHKMNNQDEPRGSIFIKVEYKPFANEQIERETAIPKAPPGTPKDGGLLVVIIHEGRFALPDQQNINPMVSLDFQGQIRTTRVMMKNKHPIWEEEFQFILEEPPIDEIVVLEVISNPRIGLVGQEGPLEEFLSRANKIIGPAMFLGVIVIHLEDVVTRKRIVGRYKLEISNGSFLEVELQWRTANRLDRVPPAHLTDVSLLVV